MTKRQGTFFADNRIVRGDCEHPGCPEKDAILYDGTDDDILVCATHFRIWAHENPRTEVCDECGASPAWRDPITRKNEFYCAKCHGAHGTVFQNRWANAPRISTPLGVHDKPKCAAADYGTDCWGEIKWRSEFDKLLCNKHAGKKSSGPAHHQKRQ